MTMTMMYCLNRCTSALPATGIALLLGTAAAYATPATYFSHSVSEVQAPSTGWSQGSDYYQNVVNADGNSASSNITTTLSEGAATAYSSADLSTGELKAYSEATASGNGGTFYPFTLAEFGDSFHTFAGGSPFTWTSATEVSFSLDISGLVDFNEPGITNESALLLYILAPGTLDAYARYAAGDSSAFYDWYPQEIAFFSYGLGGHQDLSYSEFVVNSFPDTVSASFTPGSDFDWVLGLRSTVTIDGVAGDSTAHGLSDFAHTIKVSYNGPDGATTYSSSGLPGTTALSAPPSAIPEPTSASLILGGLGGLAAIRRRRK